MERNILDLTSAEALDFFAQSEQYHNYQLPEYIGFNDILAFVRNKLENVSFEESIAQGKNPSLENDVNMDMLTNKDGHYGVRPLTLANPYLYWFLVKELCGPKGWKMTKECFDSYKIDNIEASAIPIVKDEDQVDAFPNAAIILNWWQSFERRTTQLALDYRYMFITDIANCYGTFDPRTIEWAFNRKGTQHETNRYSEAASRVCRIVEALQNGRNIGIPQGSTIFNLLGEFVLGYADLFFTEEVEKAIENGEIKTKDYRVLRYRDDYRILCNDRDDLDRISRILQHVLESLNLRMNTNKTKISDSIVTDAIKPDKLYYIENTPVFNSHGRDFVGIQKYMYYILMMGRKFPNCGTLNVLLTDLDKLVMEYLEPRVKTVESFEEIYCDDEEVDIMDIEEFLNTDFSEEDSELVATFSYDKDNEDSSSENEVPSENTQEQKPKVEKVPGRILEDATALASVAVQIAIENTQKVQYVLRVVSRIVNSLEDETLKWEIFDKVCQKLKNRPNSDYDKIWLQNITYPRDKRDGISPYSDVRLCQLVMGKRIQLWNNQWLKKEYTRNFPLASVCDQERLAKLRGLITFRETRDSYEM